MKRNIPITEIMTTELVTVQLHDPLSKVVEKLRHHHIRHLPVLLNNQLAGIISRTDINRLCFSGLFPEEEEVDEGVLEMLSLSQVMTHKPRVVKGNQTLEDVAKILAKEEFHALPVVDPQNEALLVGIVTTTDVIRYMLEEF